MTVSILAYAVFVVFVAAVVRGFSGFGFSLLTIIALSLVFPPGTIVPAMFMLEIAAGFHLLPSIWRDIRWRDISVLLAAVILAMPVGVWLLATMPEPMMKLGLAIAVLVAALVLLSGYRLRRMPTTPETVATGFASGLLNGAFGIGGPPIIIFFLGSPLALSAGRASIIATFLGMDMVGLPMLFAFGVASSESVLLFALMLPALLAGVWTGTRLVGRFQEEAVRRLVLIILIGMAILIGAQAILHLLQR
ncbi:MAG: sulfite exporter TauE/SafE family protein [Alphaproteobacteria bacterium]